MICIMMELVEMKSFLDYRIWALFVSGKIGKHFIWKSSNVKFAAVDKKGGVTTKKAGVGKRVTITATLKNCGDIATSINISIRDNSSISLSKNSIILSLAGTRTATLKATVRNTSEKVAWKTSNGQVVDVKDGKLKATGRGTAIVSAKISGKTAQCRVMVKDTAVKTVTYKFRTLEECDKAVTMGVK